MTCSFWGGHTRDDSSSILLFLIFCLVHDTSWTWPWDFWYWSCDAPRLHLHTHTQNSLQPFVYTRPITYKLHPMEYVKYRKAHITCKQLMWVHFWLTLLSLDLLYLFYISFMRLLISYSIYKIHMKIYFSIPQIIYKMAVIHIHTHEFTTSYTHTFD